MHIIAEVTDKISDAMGIMYQVYLQIVYESWENSIHWKQNIFSVAKTVIAGFVLPEEFRSAQAD